MRIIGAFFLLIFFYALPSHGRWADIDSLKSVLATSAGQQKVDILDDISWEFTFSNPDSALTYGNMQLDLAQLLDYKRGMGRAYGNLARAYYIKGDFNKALQLYDKGMHMHAVAGDRRSVATSLSNMAIIYRNQGKYSKALDNSLLALRVYKEIDNKRGQSNTYNNIGVIFKEIAEYDTALVYYNKAIEITEEIGFLRGLGNALNNSGNIYIIKQEYEKALKNFSWALNVQRKRKNEHGIADVYINISHVYSGQSNFDKALNYADSALIIYKKISNMKGIAEAEKSIAQYHLKKFNFPKALAYADRSYQKSNEIHAFDIMGSAAKVLAQIHRHTGNYQQAYDYYVVATQLEDSLQNLDLRKQLSKMQHQHEIELKNIKINSLEKEKQIDAIIKYVSFSGIIVLLIIAYQFFSRYQVKNKANQLLQAKNMEITQQKEEIETQRDNIEAQHRQISNQNEELEAQATLLASTNAKIEKAYSQIRDSIRYAKRIQQAIIGKKDLITQHFKDAFILFMPKDVVSGDFYWFHQDSEISHIKYLVCADCTGHGVPGAMMTAIGNTLLNEIIKVKKVNSPSEILAQLDIQIQKTLRQDDEEAQQDGMDMTIIKVDEQQKLLTCAGAKNPIVLIRENSIKLFKGSKFSVGGKPIRKEKEFEEVQIALQDNDCVYLYSDGYQDQFGGEKNSKYLSKRFRQLLREYNYIPFDKQKEILQKEIIEWKGQYEQTDDILVIGLAF